jgi:hypothetical protein
MEKQLTTIMSIFLLVQLQKQFNLLIKESGYKVQETQNKDTK